MFEKKFSFIFIIPNIFIVISACQNEPPVLFTRKFQLESHIRDGYLNHLNAGNVQDCNFHEQLFGNRHNRMHHEKKRVMKHQKPPYEVKRKRGTRKNHKVKSKTEAWWKHLILYRKDVDKESFNFLQDYDSKMTIFKIDNHMKRD